MRKKQIFSGIQPTGGLHLGNYLGAIRHWIPWQKKEECLFCLADYHAITIAQDPRQLAKDIFQTACLLIACGVNPSESTLFVQSHVSAHTELAWILNCFIPMGRLERMTQFKDKSQQQKESVSVGLFTYPALMASDILLYKTDIVPAGEDQEQHIELTRDIAKRFNAKYNLDIFTLPQMLLPDKGGRIMGLLDPASKMSKSAKESGQTLYLLDTADQIRSKVMKAVTDSGRELRFDKNHPAIYNLLTIYELLTGKKRAQIEKEFSQKNYVAFKEDLAQVIIEALRPIQAEFQKLQSDVPYIYAILEKGRQKTKSIADLQLKKVKKAIGLC